MTRFTAARRIQIADPTTHRVLLRLWVDNDGGGHIEYDEADLPAAVAELGRLLSERETSPASAA